VVAFEVELVFGMLGAGAPGVSEGLDGGQLRRAGGGVGVAFAGGVGADAVVFGARVGFGLPGPADLGVGVVPGLGSVGQRGVAAGFRGAGSGAGGGDGGVGLPADLGDLIVCLVAGGLRAGVSGVGVSAGLVGGLQRGLGVVPGGVRRRGGRLGCLGCLGGPGRWPSPARSAPRWRKHAPWKASATACSGTATPATPPRTGSRH